MPLIIVISYSVKQRTTTSDVRGNHGGAWRRVTQQIRYKDEPSASIFRTDKRSMQVSTYKNTQRHNPKYNSAVNIYLSQQRPFVPTPTLVNTLRANTNRLKFTVTYFSMRGKFCIVMV
jgi:hypothetical protein